MIVSDYLYEDEYKEIMEFIASEFVESEKSSESGIETKCAGGNKGKERLDRMLNGIFQL